MNCDYEVGVVLTHLTLYYVVLYGINLAKYLDFLRTLNRLLLHCWLFHRIARIERTRPPANHEGAVASGGAKRNVAHNSVNDHRSEASRRGAQTMKSIPMYSLCQWSDFSLVCEGHPTGLHFMNWVALTVLLLVVCSKMFSDSLRWHWIWRKSKLVSNRKGHS